MGAETKEMGDDPGSKMTISGHTEIGLEDVGCSSF